MAQGIKSNIYRKCLKCGSLFKTIPAYIKKGGGKFCSRICANLGYKASKEGRALMAQNLSRNRFKPLKETHWNWKGGISRAYKTGYYSVEYKKWRKEVFERDNYTCQDCGQIGVYLTAHHIKSFAKYPDLRFEVPNGKTLCEPCHSKTDNYKGLNKTRLVIQLSA